MNPSTHESFTLDWSDPFTFESLLLTDASRARFSVPGVYLWLDRTPTIPTILYVGKAAGAPDLWTRHWQHYISLIAGHYQIPEWHRTLRWEMNPSVSEVRRTVFDLQSYRVLVEDGFKYASTIEISLCPLVLPADTIARIERQLLYLLRPKETTWGTLWPPSRPLSLCHKNAHWALDRRTLASTRCPDGDFA